MPLSTGHQVLPQLEGSNAHGLIFTETSPIIHRMSQRLILATFLVFSLATALHSATLRWDTIEARIEMKPDQEEARATFTVTNEGDKAVRIARIKASCGCTGSIVDKKIIEPGESSEIVGTFNKGKRQGLNRNRLQVYLDSEPDPVATLLMTVEIPTLIEAMPQIVYWNKDSAQSARSVRLTLDKRYIDEILRIDYDRDKLTVTEAPKDENTDVARVLLVKPKDFSTAYRGTITVYSSGPKGREADTRIHAFVQP